MGSADILILKDGTSSTEFTVRVIDVVISYLVWMECAEEKRFFRVEVRLEMNVSPVNFGSRWIGRLDVTRFASRFGLVLLLVVLEIGCKGRVRFPHL